jgi:hypothetical protein
VEKKRKAAAAASSVYKSTTRKTGGKPPAAELLELIKKTVDESLEKGKYVVVTPEKSLSSLLDH